MNLVKSFICLNSCFGNKIGKDITKKNVLFLDKIFKHIPRIREYTTKEKDYGNIFNDSVTS